MKTVLFILFISIGNITYSQHILEWSFDFEFIIDKNDLPYKLDSIDFFINNSEAYPYYKEGKLIHNKDNYKLHLKYNCLGCIENEPPELYLKLYFDQKEYGIKFITYIPIYFQTTEETIVKYDLKTIKLLDFIYDYEMIEVNSNGEITRRKAGEYKNRRMNKLIEIK